MVCGIYGIQLLAKDGLADKIVKVPEMAESITEGTLKQWSKSERHTFGYRDPSRT